MKTAISLDPGYAERKAIWACFTRGRGKTRGRASLPAGHGNDPTYAQAFLNLVWFWQVKRGFLKQKKRCGNL